MVWFRALLSKNERLTSTIDKVMRQFEILEGELKTQKLAKIELLDFGLYFLLVSWERENVEINFTWKFEGSPV